MFRFLFGLKSNVMEMLGVWEFTVRGATMVGTHALVNTKKQNKKKTYFFSK